MTGKTTGTVLALKASGMLGPCPTGSLLLTALLGSGQGPSGEGRPQGHPLVIC